MTQAAPAQKPDQIAAACTGKMAFMGACGAYRALKRFTRRRKFKRVQGETVEPYLCKFCQRYHIGSALK